MKASKGTLYNHLKIEKKWQKEWDAAKTYQTEKGTKKKKMYVLDMFPYPSGAGLHVGHPRGYIGSDVYARMKRMEGFNVLHPMGFDSFGLPAEQYAIQTKKHPGPFTDKLVAQYKKQLEIIGFSYDWDREVSTHRPEYYKWTQWIFLKLYDAWYDSKKNKARTIAELISIFEKSGNKSVAAVTDANTPLFSAKEWQAFSAMEQQELLMRYRLAYEGFAEVNWCEELGTVLANDEIVDSPTGPVSERGGFPVIKKAMRQWFMRITAYADRLAADLEPLDWPSNIKEIQKNWIGKSEGSEIPFDIQAESDDKESIASVSVFTTRADTLFGVTYMVIAPEHALVQEWQNAISNWKEVSAYIQKVAQKDDTERMSTDKEKTGVQLKGLVAINPANGEAVPVWIADYVLASYGTGAVMAVPAHDERDYAFARKYGLPIREVVEPLFKKTGDKDGVKESLPFKKRHAAVAVIKHWKDDTYLCLKWKKTDWRGFVIGGIETGESAADAAAREIVEETGYTSAEMVKEVSGTVHAQFYHAVKEENRWAHFHPVVFQLKNGDQVETAESEKEIHDIVWVSKNEMETYLSWVGDMQLIWKRAFDEGASSQEGILVHSGDFDGLDSAAARAAVTKLVGGKAVTKYKMRDAIFARQRYWGEPIPLQHAANGLIVAMKEKQLPLVLPKVASYAPSGNGESPLAGVKSWVKEGYETNTMPGWAGSSWYFLRYMDPTNSKAFASEKAVDYWRDVDMYVGGAEHATGHLLYSRFWHKFLYDMGFVPTKEPFKALRNQGMIGGADGRKMSKRWGNIVNPDEVVKLYGADSLRLFEMFLGPFDSHLPWSTEGIIGSRRFIERVWRLAQKLDEKASDKSVQKSIHKTIKKVTEDIAQFAFNTSVSALMICLNEMEKGKVSTKDFALFLQLLAPFAPHIADELWNASGQKGSIHRSSWPKHNPKLLIEDEVTIGVQVNGKVRAEITVAADATKESLEAAALALPRIQEFLSGLTVRKIIVVPGRVINIVAA
ncbi:MAG: class I tRNA ligase family protein [Patescibacteria group bacterium]